MIQESEIICLLLGLGVLIFILGNLSRLNRFCGMRTLLASYAMLLAGWILTVLEGFWGETVFNVLEHLCYALSSLLMTVWFWKVLFDTKRFNR